MLRRFAGFLVENHPEIRGLVDVERVHIEAFKRYLPTRPGRSGSLSPATIRMTLGTLRTFFERVSEWDYPDAPTRVLIFNGDLPTPDAPLPKFLSDVDAGKFMRAAAEAAPVRRLVVEMLVRTGLRVTELCTLEADAVMFRTAGTGSGSRSASSTTTATCPCTHNFSSSSTSTGPHATTASTGCWCSTVGPCRAIRCPAWSAESPTPPGSDTSIPTSSATPSPPRPSTAG